MIKIIKINYKNSKGTHWVLLFIDRNTAVYFDSFGVEYIPLQVLNKIRDKSVTVYLKYKNLNLLCVHFYCITFIEYMLSGKTLLYCTNLFSLNGYKKNGR